MIRASRVACAAVLLLALTPAPRALAQARKPPPTAEDAAKLRAQAIFDEAMRLFGDGDYVVALEKFRAARAEFPSPKILVNIGTTLRQLGRNVEAAETYEAYLADPGQDPKRAEEVKRSLAELDALLGRIRIEVTTPTGAPAEVRLDGKVIERFENGVVVRVEPGDHTVVAELAGFPPVVQKARIDPRSEKRFELAVVPEKQKTVVVSRDAPVPKTQRTIGFIAGGVGVLGLGAGAVFGLLAKSKNDEAASEHCLTETRCDARGVELGDAARTHATISTVTFAVGGALVAGGVVLLLTAPSKKSPAAPPAKEGARPTVSLRSMVGPNGAGGALEGRW